MAKRRKLTAPSPEDLTQLEQEFRRETPASSAARAPIAQVAAEAALAAPVLDPDTRADAAAWREGLAAGRVIHEIALDQIAPEDMVRDRVALDDEQMTELRLSIAQNGLRLPIELYNRDDPDGGPAYGILSGYRRYCAFRALHGLTGDPKYARIPALIRKPGSVSEAFVAMVEENEIRSDLSQFERGRIVSISAQMGVFDSVETAVNALFANASKAKRSKIRSFALIFAELGNTLSFPDALTEKQGLRLAGALRAGAQGDLFDALDQPFANAGAEWAALNAVITRSEDAARDLGSGGASKGGRPRKTPQPQPGQGARRLETATGVTLSVEEDGAGHLIRLHGDRVDATLAQELMQELALLLAPSRRGREG